ncbi:MAG TPA: hypothetical protein VMZ74_05535 [Ramlibacter sp.]|nr:hypothetical protein [Ramlibacter sp.]
MANERTQQHQQQQKTDKPVNQPKAQTGRTGEGSRSVLPHLKSDQKARAVARIPKRLDREWS